MPNIKTLQQKTKKLTQLVCKNHQFDLEVCDTTSQISKPTQKDNKVTAWTQFVTDEQMDRVITMAGPLSNSSIIYTSLYT